MFDTEFLERSVKNIMYVYEKIREYIDTNGYNENVIAEKSGISITVFNDMMSGKRTIYADDFKSICIALNVKPEIFLNL